MVTTVRLQDRVVLVTNTRYDGSPDTHSREFLGRQLFEHAALTGYKIITADGGSRPEFLDHVKTTGATLMQDTYRTRGEQRRAAYAAGHASGAEFIYWLEPEKVQLLNSIDIALTPLLEGNANLVIPARPWFEGYPAVQAASEHYANAVWERLTGQQLDVWFGPRVVERDSVHYFTEYRSLDFAKKWGPYYPDDAAGQFVPVLDALMEGKSVAGVQVPYTHPSAQSYEEKDTRAVQKRHALLEEIIPTLQQHFERRKARAARNEAPVNNETSVHNDFISNTGAP